MRKKYIVTLIDEERDELKNIVTKGKGPAYKIKHAHILLNTDTGGSSSLRTDKEIADAFCCHANTVANVRQRYVEEGLESALKRRKREKPPISKKIDGEKEARLIQIACSQPPEGSARWTLEMLANEMVELEVIESVSASTIQRTLKKMNLSPISESSG